MARTQDVRALRRALGRAAERHAGEPEPERSGRELGEALAELYVAGWSVEQARQALEDLRAQVARWKRPDAGRGPEA